MDNLLTPQEAAQHFKVHYRTLGRWTRQGCPCYRQGSTVRYRISEVERWMAKGKAA